jgi:PhzF family phenazine biosynthesis protein
MPSDREMFAVATRVGYCETAFVTLLSSDGRHWRVRFFAPKGEVPFCGHATTALTAALAEHTEFQNFTLMLKAGLITTRANRTGKVIEASFTSPAPMSRPACQNTIESFWHFSIFPRGSVIQRFLLSSSAPWQIT